MSLRDYYEVLGVRPMAATDEIKKAYRRLAVQYHPDRNPDKPEAEDRFKEISEAYAILSDRATRSKYDSYGHAGVREHPDDDPLRNVNTADLFKDFGLGGEEFFSRLFGGRAGSRRKSPGADRSGFSMSDLFGDFGRETQPPRRRGADITVDLHVSLSEATFGAQRLVAYNTDMGVTKTMVRIPPGVPSGLRIRALGQGLPSPDQDGSSGDLLVRIVVMPHPRFHREGADLVTEVRVTPEEAESGGRVRVDTLDGKALNLRVPAGTAPDARLRIQGHGAAVYQGTSRGDLIVRLRVSGQDANTPRFREPAAAAAGR